MGSWNIYGYTPNGKDKPAVRIVSLDNEEETVHLTFSPAEFVAFIDAALDVQHDWQKDIEGKTNG